MISDFFNFFEISFIGRCVVIGDTDNFLLKINIANFFLFVFSAKYSVIPKYLLPKKFFFEIGPLINLLDIPFLIRSIAKLNEFLM